MAKILVVDDALFMRKMLSDLLIKEGHEIIGQAENAKTAIEQYKKLSPDLVTMDVIMPEIDGITTLEAISDILEANKNAKIIMVSAMGQQDIISEMIQAGAKDFIIKPFNAEDVVKVIQNQLGK